MTLTALHSCSVDSALELRPVCTLHRDHVLSLKILKYGMYGTGYALCHILSRASVEGARQLAHLVRFACLS